MGNDLVFRDDEAAKFREITGYYELSKEERTRQPLNLIKRTYCSGNKRVIEAGKANWIF